MSVPLFVVFINPRHANAARQVRETSDSRQPPFEVQMENAKELIRSGGRDVARIQLAFVGALGAGKTNLCTNLIKPGFNEKSDSTVGIDLLHTSAVLQKENMQAQSSSQPCGPLLAIARKSAAVSSSIAHALRPARVEKEHFLRPKKLPSKFHVPGALLSDVKDALNDPDEEVIFADLLDCGGQLSFSVVQSVCFSENTIFFLTYNSRIPLNVEIAASFRDEGGNPIQYATPKLLHSDFLSSWLSTLSMVGRNRPQDRQPTVVLVGTHSAELSESESRSSDDALRSLLNKYADAPLRILGPFRVDNKHPESKAMADFRHEVHRLIYTKRRCSNLPHSLISSASGW